jgi:predicted aspartyl protease
MPADLSRTSPRFVFLKNIFFGGAPTKLKAGLVVSSFVLLAVCKTLSQGATTLNPAPSNSEIRLFTAPDEASAVVAILTSGDEISPLADTLGSENLRWYLVKAKNGAVGWIKNSDTDESRKLEKFFKSLPAETSFPASSVVPSSSAAALGPITVPVMMNGASVIVPVTLNGEFRASLGLDTGATITVLSHRIAKSLGLNPLGTSKVGTVGGIITVPLARLRSLEVGDAAVHDLVVSIHDFSTDPRIEGLLGLDYLKHFSVSLDARRKLLVLSPR